MKQQGKATPKGRAKSTAMKELVIVFAPDGAFEEVQIKYELGQEWGTDEAKSKLFKWIERGPKRGKGRPPIFDKKEILTAAARAKVTEGKYLQIARARFGMTPRQLQDLVADNQEYFKRKVAQIRVTQHCPCVSCVQARLEDAKDPHTSK
jgi:hypothetical protein